MSEIVYTPFGDTESTYSPYNSDNDVISTTNDIRRPWTISIVASLFAMVIVSIVIGYVTANESRNTAIDSMQEFNSNMTIVREESNSEKIHDYTNSKNIDPRIASFVRDVTGSINNKEITPVSPDMTAEEMSYAVAEYYALCDVMDSVKSNDNIADLKKACGTFSDSATAMMNDITFYNDVVRRIPFMNLIMDTLPDVTKK